MSIVMQSSRHSPLIVGGHDRWTEKILTVTDKWTGTAMGQVCCADSVVLDEAIGYAAAAMPMTSCLSLAERRAILDRCCTGLEREQNHYVEIMVSEAGKTIQEARMEWQRCLDTFRLAAAACHDAQGEVLALDSTQRGQGYRGWYRRVPVGPVLLISPFNFPLNLVAHKVAPAIAAGCPWVLKPASKTPMIALLLGRLIVQSGWPVKACSVLPCDRQEAQRLVESDVFRLLSFTGSADVGWALKSRAGRKRVLLELGGNAACILARTADWQNAVPALVRAAFGQAGQSCISVQRLFVHHSIYDCVRNALLEHAKAFRVGTPEDEHACMGPMIDDREARRLAEWVAEAQAAGGGVLLGSTIESNHVQPVILESVPEHYRVVAEEVFAPLLVLDCFDQLPDLITQLNKGRYGLQLGIYTQDISEAMHCWDHAEVGGVIVNDVPSWRSDLMPYGGVKDSGIGREGVRAAIQEMTESRLMVLHQS